MGEMEVPDDALYGASTQRALLNFTIGARPLRPELICAIGQVKYAACFANRELGRLSPERAALILTASREVADGRWNSHFPVDIFQTGSGTSSNMNANEVIANRCAQLAGNALGSKEPVHPNDHVNLGQSSNDVFPTAIHVAAGQLLQTKLLPQLARLHSGLLQKSAEFYPILKLGRTHLMDATPISLGEVFGAFARQIALGSQRIRRALSALFELPLGGTAVGTGINGHPDFASHAIVELTRLTDLPWKEALNHIEAQSARDALVEVSGLLKTLAVSLTKIADDLRWMASGPHGGLGELRMPPRQPGSSIMPGKVNPVICESLLQACSRVVGNDATLTWAAARGNFELNTMMPLLADTLLDSIQLLSNGSQLLHDKCIQELQALPAHCAALLDQSLALATRLVPLVGYERAAALALQSQLTGKTLRELCLEQLTIPESELHQALDSSQPLRHT